MKKLYILLLTAFISPVTLLHSEIITDGTLGNQTSLTGPDFQIDQSLGQLSGGNLFHSFSQFNLHTGESATFNGASTIQNIIARVTGGASAIDGGLGSSIAGANLYLINPAGIIFGGNASLNLSGSFYASTADYLKLGANDYFYSNPIQGNLISSAAPESFGFLTSSGTININGATLAVDTGKNLTFSAKHINMSMANLNAVDGSVSLNTNPGAGIITDKSDNITLTNSTIKSGGANGAIFIKGGNILIQNSKLENTTTGNASADLISLEADQLTITDRSYIKAYTSGNGKAADIHIKANELTISQSSNITSTTNYSGPGSGGGHAGAIQIEAINTLIDNAQVQSNSLRGNGLAGSISITSDCITLQNDSIISNSKVGMGFGKNGSISLKASEALIISGSQVVSETVIGMANGGNISIEVPRLTLTNHAAIYSNSRGMGQAGHITIKANNANLLDGSLVESSALSTGSGGEITFNINNRLTLAGTLTLNGITYSSQILTRSTKAGHGGNIHITSGDLVLSDGATISAASKSTVNPGNAGNITIKSNTINLGMGTEITAESEGSAGGQIQIDCRDYLALFNADIATRVHNGVGNAGNIHIFTGKLVLNNSFVRADAMAGNGGNIYVNADYIIQNYGSFFDASSQLGIAGELLITAPQTDINQEIEELVTDFLPADEWIYDSARARLGDRSSFIISRKTDATDRLPAFLSSPVIQSNRQTTTVPNQLKLFLGF